MDTMKPPAPNAPEADSAEPRTSAEDAATAAVNTPADTPAETTDAKAVPAAEELDDTLDAETDAETDAELDSELDSEDEPFEQVGGVGAAASAIVAAGLGLVALSGTWVSRVVAERQTLIGQIESVNAAITEAKIAALYGDAWHQTALVNGVFSTLALLLAVFVLARPAFGAPGRILPTWIRSVSWAAVMLGALGVLLFGLMYFDILLPLPKAAG